MPGENRFQLLSSLSNHSFKVVFVTAYNKYALQAIRASALVYILKPVKIDELHEVVEKIKKWRKQERAFYFLYSRKNVIRWGIQVAGSNMVSSYNCP